MSSPKTPDAAGSIDAHVHLWRYVPAEHPWMTGAMTAIQRDFLPAELAAQMAASGIASAIPVQARHSLDETRWLLDLADEHPFLAGVVGWVPLASPDVAQDLERLADRPKLRGVRHVVLDDPDDALMLRDDWNRGVALLAAYGLRYDLIVYERHLPQAITLVDRHPRQIFVLDHVARPEIRGAPSALYRDQLRALAARPHVYCKLSGLTTGTGPGGYTADDLAPYVDLALEAFGPRRLMFGSDWPMCILTCDYARWTGLVQQLTAALSPDERAWIWRRTAEEAYGLPGGSS
ncbi:L-fuconolactone hydrolase [Minicystis rosea]|nr:L-fuconolactone hydrolase [Minicystis rosea]